LDAQNSFNEANRARGQLTDNTSCQV